jgi:WD40 repeat protein
VYVALSPDGRMMASSGANGSIRLCNVDTGSVIGTLDGASFVLSLAFSPDGAALAAGCDDRTVKIWKVDYGSSAR